MTRRRLLEALGPFVVLLALIGLHRFIFGAPLSSEALRPSAAGLLPKYVGAEACGRCHADVYASWRGTKMSRAHEVLPDTAAQNPECLGCHYTGYGQADPPLPGIQCEACHGPGGRYVVAMARGASLDEIRAAGLVFPGEADCLRCHTPAWSPDFRLTDRTRAGVHQMPIQAPSGAAFTAEPVGGDRCRSCHGPYHAPCPERYVAACEDCHGPGSRYIPLMATRGTRAARVEAGLIIPERTVCTNCHASEGVEVDIDAAAADAPAVPVGAATCQRCHGPRHAPCPQTKQCESCHGAGSKFVPLMARRAGARAYQAAGLTRGSRSRCDQCHARAGVRVEAPSDTEPVRVGNDRCLMCHDPRPHTPCPKTTDCESCHGPGSKFVEVMAQGGSAAERTAAGLRMPARQEACEACHARRSTGGAEPAPPATPPVAPAPTPAATAPQAAGETAPATP